MIEEFKVDSKAECDLKLAYAIRIFFLCDAKHNAAYAVDK